MHASRCVEAPTRQVSRELGKQEQLICDRLVDMYVGGC